MSLILQNIQKGLGDFELHAHFKIGPQERLGISGRSGGGKTSLLKLILGAMEPDSGEIKWGTQSLKNIPIEKRDFGMVFQNQGLLPHLSLKENLILGLKLRKFSSQKILELSQPWLERLKLNNASQKISEISGGERQKLALARALIWGPRLVMLDEPFSALDPASKKLTKDFMIQVFEETKVPVLIVSHDIQDLVDLTESQLALMEADQGRIRRFHRAFV